MTLSENIRELFVENPMTLEATRTVRRTLRAGTSNENPYASRNLNRFLVGTLVLLYGWLLAGIIRSNENISIFLLLGELGLLTLLVPGSLYGAIAVEREKQTYESLILTRLTPAQIVCGKLVWRVGLIAGLMALFVPLLIVSELMGHSYANKMTWGQVAWLQAVIFAWSVLVGAFSLWVSARSKKGITALLGIVGALVAFLALVPLLFDSAVHLDRNYPFAQVENYYYNETEMPEPNHSTDSRQVAIAVGAGAVVALNPVVMTFAPAYMGNDSGSNSISALWYWHLYGIGYWGVAVYAALTGVLIRSSVKTLRGLEMPVAEKVRRAKTGWLPRRKGA